MWWSTELFQSISKVGTHIQSNSPREFYEIKSAYLETVKTTDKVGRGVIPYNTKSVHKKQCK